MVSHLLHSGLGSSPATSGLRQRSQRPRPCAGGRRLPRSPGYIDPPPFATVHCTHTCRRLLALPPASPEERALRVDPSPAQLRPLLACLARSAGRRMPVRAEGVTNLDAKGDGVHFISNGKDQCVKLWDMRRSYSDAEGHEKASRRDVPRYHWCAVPASVRACLA